MQRQQSAVVHIVDCDLVGQIFTQIAHIVPFHRAIDDDIEAHGYGRNHHIIQHAAIFGQQKRIAHLTFMQRGNVTGHQRLKRFGGTVAGQHQLSHMADIKQSGIFARPEMFGDDAFILDGHVIARKLDHARALGAVPCV